MEGSVTTGAPLAAAERQIGANGPPASRDSGGAIIPITKYRKLTGDYASPDARILERIRYLEQFCRAAAQAELATYVETKKRT
jgi:hypothetical protein